MLSNAEAVIIANNSRAFQFGVYFVTFVLCLRWLLYTDEGWSLRRNIKWLEVTATVMIFVLSVANIALSLESTLAICRGKTDTYLTGIITSIIEALTAIIIEVILIFRCWIIHHRSWRTITPPLLLLLYSVCGIVIVTYWSTLHLTGRQNVNFTWIKRVHGSFFVSTILINIYATSAIVLRIQRDSYFQDLHFVIRNITESGTLYTLTSILAICAISIGRSPTLESPTARVVACVMCFQPVAGISYNLVLIRAGQHRISTRTPSLEFVGPPASAFELDEISRPRARSTQRSLSTL